MFLEISQNSRENTSARASGLRPATLLKKRLWHRCFPVNFVKFLRTPFLTEHLPWLLLYMRLAWDYYSSALMFFTPCSPFWNRRKTIMIELMKGLFYNTIHHWVWYCWVTHDKFLVHYRVIDVIPFHNTGLLLYPSKTSENLRFFDVFRGYRKWSVTWNGLSTWADFFNLFDGIYSIYDETCSSTSLYITFTMIYLFLLLNTFSLLFFRLFILV